MAKHVPLEELEDYEKEGWWHNGWLSMKNETAEIVKDDTTLPKGGTR